MSGKRKSDNEKEKPMSKQRRRSALKGGRGDTESEVSSIYSLTPPPLERRSSLTPTPLERRSSVTFPEISTKTKVFSIPRVPTSQKYTTINEDDDIDDDDDDIPPDYVDLRGNDEKEEEEEEEEEYYNENSDIYYDNTFEKYVNKWKTLQKELAGKERKNELNNLCIADEDFSYNLKEDNIDRKEVKKIQNDLFQTFRNNYHYFEHLKTNWGDNIASCFMISFNKKSIVLVGEHHKIHTPASVKKYSYDMNLQYDIFYTLVELSNQFCTQLPLRYRPFPFFIEMSSDNEFLAYKRVNSKCINIVQSDMRCLSGTVMCRPHTSSDRDHVLLSIQKKIFSADNFTTKNIQSILYELFFKIFKKNDDTMRDNDDSETNEIS